MTRQSSAAVAEAAGVPAWEGVADLHVHTTISDGSYTFSEVLGQACERGLGCVAFTNHDTTRGLAEAAAEGERVGVRVIGGIEVSAYDFARGRKVHVLGLGMREGARATEELCASTLERRDALSRWQLDRLLEEGFDVDVPRALSLAEASRCLYKQHIMAALTQAPFTSFAYQDLYYQLFKGEGVCARDITYVDARDAVRAIVEDGGLAVLAHPGQLDSYDIVPELVACGLGGIEQRHPDHTPADVERCAELASRFRLLATGGSDFHGLFGKVPHVGYGLV